MASWRTYLQILLCIGLLFFMIPIKIEGPDEVNLQFQEYLKQFNKTYEDRDVYQRRFEAFKKNVDNIKELNANQNDKSNQSARYGLTKYSDLLPEEFLNNHLQANLSQRLTKHYSHFKHKDHKREVFLKKIDWRQKNAVTKVYNQGPCGACWAFAAVETIESMHAIKTNTLQDLSVQEVLDCYSNNKGCEGGDVCNLLSWMKTTNFTIHTKSDYAHINKCVNVTNPGVQMNDFICDKLVGSESVMMKLLAENGPLSVAINAQTWQNYIGGVIEYHCDGNVAKLNHAVQIVGYDLTATIPHYIVRNSWGEDFGDGGYLYVAIDKNMCGVANEVSALTVL